MILNICVLIFFEIFIFRLYLYYFIFICVLFDNNAASTAIKLCISHTDTGAVPCFKMKVSHIVSACGFHSKILLAVRFVHILNKYVFC